MQQTVEELAALVHGRVLGVGSRLIHAAKPVSDAKAGDVTFVENERYMRMMHACQASAVVVPRALTAEFADLLANLPVELSVIEVPEAMSAFITIAQHFLAATAIEATGIDPRSSVHPTARVGPEPSIQPFAAVGAGTVIGARCRIYPGVAIGRNCRLGDDVTLFPNVVIYDGIVLGDRVVLHANCAIGADGFGYRHQDGRQVKVPQLSHVEIEDDVEIGAGTAVDRGTFQPTRIGAGTKIDNHVQIAHNCKIGRHNLIVSQVGIAGSCTTGDYVVLAGQAGVADHVAIGDRAVIGARSAIHRDVPPDGRMLGVPARAENETKRILAVVEHLPEMRRDVRSIKQHLGLDQQPKAAG